jgi:hypothetical protein
MNEKSCRDIADKKLLVIHTVCFIGYLSMLLSEMLPPSRVERFILIDKAWPLHNQSEDEIQSHHINHDHIYEPYYERWPIPLVTSKRDLKKSRQCQDLSNRYFAANGTEDDGSSHPNPVIVLAIHLCGTLSIKAIEFFNQHPHSIVLLCLKPCCLPPMVHAKRQEIFVLSSSSCTNQQQHSFPATSVCMPGKWKNKK